MHSETCSVTGWEQNLGYTQGTHQQCQQAGIMDCPLSLWQYPLQVQDRQQTSSPVFQLYLTSWCKETVNSGAEFFFWSWYPARAARGAHQCKGCAVTMSATGWSQLQGTFPDWGRNVPHSCITGTMWNHQITVITSWTVAQFVSSS